MEFCRIALTRIATNAARTLGCLSFLLAPAAGGDAQTATVSADPGALVSPDYGEGSNRVRAIILHGNRRTRDWVVRHCVRIDSGDVYDSATTAQAAQRLEGTRLFRDAKIFPTFKQNGIDLHVILDEATYVAISDVGGEFVQGLYGLDEYDQKVWLRMRLGIELNNFRGQMERLRLNVGFFRSRYLKLSWYKPFIGTPYFVTLGVGAYRRPDTYKPLDRFTIHQTTSVGRWLNRHSKVHASLLPTYSSRTRAEAAGPLDTVREEAFRELMLAIGWSTDHRNRGFDPNRGVYIGVESSTNALMPRDRDHTYLEFGTETRFYHRGFREDNAVAYRLGTTVRVDTAGEYDGLYAGGQSGPRGYGEGTIGNSPYFTANNSVLAGVEYRFPLFTTPSMSFGRFSRFHKGLNNFYYRVDGAAFVDAAYLWHRLEDPLPAPKRAPETSEQGVGAGLGLRVVAPTVAMTGSLDFAWGLTRGGASWTAQKEYDYYVARSKKTWLGRELAERRRYLPAVYLYLGLPF